MTEYWGGTIHFFSLTLYNFKNIGGRIPPCLSYSAVPVHTVCEANICPFFFKIQYVTIVNMPRVVNDIKHLINQQSFHSYQVLKEHSNVNFLYLKINIWKKGQ